MATDQPTNYRPLSNAQLRAGTAEYGELTAEVWALLETLERTYSWRDRFLRPGFLIDEATEILDDLAATDSGGNLRPNYARLDARRVPVNTNTIQFIKIWATREVSLRRRWISTLKLGRWIITLIAPIPAIAAANFLSRWAIETFLDSV